jgi:hypothetical protein
VRVIVKPRPRISTEARVLLGIALVLAAAVGVSLWAPSATNAPTTQAPADPLAERAVPGPIEPAARASNAVVASTPPSIASINTLRERASPTGDPDDLATHFRSGDAVPDTANLIKALNDAGIREGIAAFNPPGTRPPLAGLAVPPDFALPPGYVRHHQSHDDGTPIEPILMFSPDFVLRDAQGRVIPLPADRVVPPGMAPPGLPIRWVQPGKP